MSDSYLSSKRFVVLASGGGSNFLSLIDAVQKKKIQGQIAALVVDRPCGAQQLARENNIDCFELYRKNKVVDNTEVLLAICSQVELVVCAGFLSIIDESFIERFSGKIINIHPSLLPKYGGAKMYGMNVHCAVIAAQEKVSGCSVHFVDRGIDTGDVIAQSTVAVDSTDTAQSLQKKVLAKEHELLPSVVSQLLKN